MLILMCVLILLQHSVDITVSTTEITSINTFLSRPCFITIRLSFLISKLSWTSAGHHCINLSGALRVLLVWFVSFAGDMYHGQRTQDVLHI